MPSVSPFSRLSDRALALALALLALGIAGWITAQSPHSSFDDSFYYLKIAQNIAAGNGSTFDGIHWTNGYHPLWLGCLVLIFWLTPALETAALLARVLQAIIFAASAGLIYALARNLFERGAAILTCLTWILFSFRESLDGMEYGVVTLGMIVAALGYVCWFAVRAKAETYQYTLLGVIVSITILARLDNLLLAPCLGIFLLYAEWRSGFTRAGATRWLCFAAPIALTSAIYAVANQVIFGLPVPVSGIVKRAWSDYYLIHDPAFSTGGWLAAKFNLLLIPFQAILQLRHISWLLFPVLLVLGAYGAPLALLVESSQTPARLHKPGLRALAPFALFSALNYLSYLIFFHSWIAYSPWYFAIQPVMTALLCGAIAANFSNQPANPPSVFRWREPAGTITGLAILAYVTWSISFPFPPTAPPQIDPLENAARWLKTHTPTDATIGSWNAGIVGYYSQRRVINLDGLVNSWDYFVRDQFDLCDYWQKNHVAFLADYFEGDQALGPMPVYPSYKKCADQLELVWSEDTQRINRRVQIYRLPAP